MEQEEEQAGFLLALPVEVLAQIVSLAAAGAREVDALWRVCRTTRAVMESIPSFWRHAACRVWLPVGAENAAPTAGRSPPLPLRQATSRRLPARGPWA
jgi:hypothetical protein